jgi:hypothetical protein
MRREGGLDARVGRHRAAQRADQRNAFVDGCQHIRMVYCLAHQSAQAQADYHEAERRFPRPVVTKYNEVRFSHGAPFPSDAMVAFRWVGEDLQSQDVRASDMTTEHGWVSRSWASPAFIEKLAELKTKPTYEVPE